MTHLVQQTFDNLQHLVLIDRIESSLDVHLDKVQARPATSALPR